MHKLAVLLAVLLVGQLLIIWAVLVWADVILTETGVGDRLTAENTACLVTEDTIGEICAGELPPEGPPIGSWRTMGIGR